MAQGETQWTVRPKSSAPAASGGHPAGQAQDRAPTQSVSGSSAHAHGNAHHDLESMRLMGFWIFLMLKKQRRIIKTIKNLPINGKLKMLTGFQPHQATKLYPNSCRILVYI